MDHPIDILDVRTAQTFNRLAPLVLFQFRASNMVLRRLDAVCLLHAVNTTKEIASYLTRAEVVSEKVALGGPCVSKVIRLE